MTRILRLSQMGLVVVFALFLSGASDTNTRYTSLGHRMMCVCGCNQVLIECNHVGCQDSRRMLAELQTGLSRGDSDISILKAFQAEYGPVAMAAPMFTRFNHIVWIAPPLFLLIGLAIIVALVRRWRLHLVDRPEMLGASDLADVRKQIREETEL